MGIIKVKAYLKMGCKINKLDFLKMFGLSLMEGEPLLNCETILQKRNSKI